ncbi:Protein of uncharacterised function (DUF2752) [uncultured Clostridium sp.]|uniref:DUF2752 domain-containing protein n=1 Tax=uncultured Clostridium sp. TaxID=59620 RepID=UPI000821279A|nr:DUF2752 domain-containing protein [uncultured Clostridium sp.]SCJ94834.1 Protein of uncharacterised function (DUF2752) [uncultured Clostridium sp.]
MKNNKRIIFIVLISIMLWIILLRLFSNLTGTICLIRGIIGIPCPACGITRAIKSLIRLNIKDALYYNPLFLMPFIFMVVLIFKRKYIKVTAKVCAITFIIVYIFRMSLYFPNTEPMRINEDSILIKYLIN